MQPSISRGGRWWARVLLALLLFLTWRLRIRRRLQGLPGRLLQYSRAAAERQLQTVLGRGRPVERSVGRIWSRAGRPKTALGSLLMLVLLLACARSLPIPRPPAGEPGRRPAAAAKGRAETSPPSRAASTDRVAEEARTAAPFADSTLLRVGLATDLPIVELPSGGGPLRAEARGRVYTVQTPLEVSSAAEILEAGFYRLQAAALKDEIQARSLGQQLLQDLGPPSDVVFDAGSDLYRVRVGRFASRQAADEARGRLARQGLREAWVVSEKARLRDPALRLSSAGQSERVPGRWLALSNDEGQGLRIGGRQVRGRLLVYLNDRGSLNLINELSLEDYLRGVVPREMGPEEYGNLEALKAQAVAARTYTLSNLGEFVGEGYDICATPRCQVYGGMAAEHPLSDRAVAETSGEVLQYNGELVDALYSSTCGGHTEDVGVVFPQKNEPYLKGVVCLESGGDRLTGVPYPDARFPVAMMQQFLPPKGLQSDPEVLAARLEHLALLAGLPMPADRLASLDRREVQRFLASIFDLVLDVERLAGGGEASVPDEQTPAGWSARDLRLAVYLRENELLPGNPAERLTPTQIEESLLRLALFLGVVREVEGSYQGLDGESLLLRGPRETLAYRLADNLITYRGSGEGLSAAPLYLLPADRLVLYLHDREILAVTQEADDDTFYFELEPGQRSWVRYRSDAQLTELVNGRYPGLGFSDLIIESRGVSGRVARVRIEGGGDRRVEVEGLAIRWTLDLPDTLFTVERVTLAGGRPGWRFSGRGRGHGVGLCQVGAYGMALRGHSYTDILEHYYTGVKVTKLGRSAGGMEAASLR